MNESPELRVGFSSRTDLSTEKRLGIAETASACHALFQRKAGANYTFVPKNQQRPAACGFDWRPCRLKSAFKGKVADIVFFKI
jgi:hypothetical protein